MFKILVVDDDADHRETVVELLRDRYHVVAAADAIEALALDPASFDLVLTDLRMPGVSGIELKHQFCERGASAAMVLMSSEVGIGKEAVQEGFHDFLAKPFSVDQLEAVIALHASEKVQITEALDQPALVSAVAATAALEEPSKSDELTDDGEPEA